MNKVLRYRILNKIGSGGMATVYLAEDEVLHRRVAVKMVHPHLLERSETIQRFSNEAKAVARLSHQNVIRLYDYGEEDGKRFLVMEYVDGVVLDSILEQRPPLPGLVVLELMKQILSGLQAAHREGIYHRDIKPGNIMIDKDGCVKIMDFGIAFLAHQESITLTGTFVGSPNYISPEQAAGEPLSGETDVFSVGALAFQCITGVPPFQAENAHATVHRILHDEAQKADQLNTHTLFGLSDIVDRCLTKSIQHRPNAEECCASIEEYLTRHNLQTGAGRLIEYVENPKAYTGKEERELYACFMAHARNYSQNRQVAPALRAVNQAKALGRLSRSDAAFVDNLGRQKRRQDAASVLLKFAAIVLLGFMAQHFLRTATTRSPEGFLSYEQSSRSPGTAEVSEAPRAHEVTSAAETPKEGANPVIDTQDAHPAVQNPLPKASDENETRRVEPDKTSRKGHNQTGGEESSRLGDVVLPTLLDSGIVGYLKLHSRPPWAAVRIDGIKLGETPVTLSLKPGEYVMSLNKNGYRSVEKTIHIESSDTLLKRVELHPDSLSADPAIGMNERIDNR